MFLTQSFKKQLILFILGCTSLYNYGQVNTDSLYTDFKMGSLEAVNPVGPQHIYKRGFYIRNLQARKKNKATIELINVYSDSSTGIRKARAQQADYGNIVVFDVLKTAGFEKVLFFGDHDYHYDSLLARQDTIFFKEQSNDLIEFSVVYPVVNDTLTIKYGCRNIRTDFLKNIYYRPP